MKRSLVGLVAGCFLGVVGASAIRALAEPAVPPTKSLERRVSEVEAELNVMELRLQMMQSRLERTPRLGTQAARAQ